MSDKYDDGDEYGEYDEEEEYEVEEMADDKPMCVLGRVFLGSIDAARNREALNAASISVTLGLLGVDDERIDGSTDDGVTRTHIQIEDAMDERLFERLPSLLATLTSILADADRRDTNVLVHCMAGRSRSPSVVAAWFVAFHKYSIQQAIDHIEMIRPWIEINPRFRRDLELFGSVVRWERDTEAAAVLQSLKALDNLPRLDFGATLVADIIGHKKTVTMRLESDVETDVNSDLRLITQFSTVQATSAPSHNEANRAPFAYLRVDRIETGKSLSTMSPATIAASGFDSVDQVLQVLRSFYPHVTDTTPLLAIHFSCLGAVDVSAYYGNAL